MPGSARRRRQDPAALSVLGLILHARGRHEDAVRVFRALSLMQPQDAGHWINLGSALRPTKRFDEALAAYQRAAELGAPPASVLYSLGLAHMDLCQYPQAYEALEQAVGLDPTGALVRSTFAQCCYEMIRFDEGVAALENWQDLQGLKPELLAQIAYLLVMMGGPARADSAIRRATEAARTGVPPLMLVRLLERINRPREAHAALARLKAAGSSEVPDPDVLLAEAVLAERDGASEEARRLLSLIREQSGDFKRQHHVLFPLARSLDTLGRYDDAYAIALEAHRSQAAYLEAAMGKRPEDGSPTLGLAAHGVQADDVRGWNDSDAPSLADSPIFIVAFPRSGTTLLEQMLDAHPDLVSMDETAFLKWALDDALACGISYPADLGKLTAAQLKDIRTRYWEQVRGKVGLRPGQRLVDKNPLNMMRLPFIRRLFPNARTILTVRHPCDTLISCFLQHFRAPDLALVCRSLPTLAQSYRTAFDYWYAQQPLLGAATYELRYETLVADLDNQVRQLAQFLELPFNAAMLSPGEHARTKGYISTPSYTQVVQPISARSVGRWRNYETYLAEVVPTLAPYLRRWGYS